MGLLKSIAGFFKSEDDSIHRVALGRNDHCWCGSGKKYKKCHLDEEEKKLSKYRSINCGTT